MERPSFIVNSVKPGDVVLLLDEGLDSARVFAETTQGVYVEKFRGPREPSLVSRDALVDKGQASAARSWLQAERERPSRKEMLKVFERMETGDPTGDPR